MRERNTKHGPFDRFLKCQERIYDVALQELKEGRKCTHLIGYIFPQIRGLAKSRKSFVFGIINVDYAKEYLDHPLLGPRLIASCEAILTHKGKSAEEILGDADALKLQSCATLFSLVSKENSVFHQVLEQFYEGECDPVTLGLASGRILDFTYRKYLLGVDW